MFDDYRLLTVEKQVFAPATTDLVEKIQIPDIVSNLKLDSWSCLKEPNFKEDGEEVGNSFHLERWNNSEDGSYHRHIFKPHVTKNYSVMNYAEGIQWLDYFVTEGLLDIHSVFYVEPGAKLNVTCTMGLEAQVVPGDTVNRFLIFSLSHDGSRRMIGFTDICPVCENTLMMAQHQSMAKASKNFQLDGGGSVQERLMYAKGVIDVISQRFMTEAMPLYKAYNQMKLEDSQRDYIFRKAVNAPIEKSISEMGNASRGRLLALEQAYHDSPGQELRAEGSGYRILSAVSNYTKYLGNEDNPGLGYYQDRFGKGCNIRKNTMEMLNSLLPDYHIDTGAEETPTLIAV